jgi:hypothetical protein
MYLKGTLFTLILPPSKYNISYIYIKKMGMDLTPSRRKDLMGKMERVLIP